MNEPNVIFSLSFLMVFTLHTSTLRPFKISVTSAKYHLLFMNEKSPPLSRSQNITHLWDMFGILNQLEKFQQFSNIKNSYIGKLLWIKYFNTCHLYDFQELFDLYVPQFSYLWASKDIEDNCNTFLGFIRNNVQKDFVT